MSTPLVVESCRSACAWSATRERLGELALFRCAACGSEWVRTEPWTPADADGTVAPSVAEEAAQRGPAPGPVRRAGA